MLLDKAKTLRISKTPANAPQIQYVSELVFAMWKIMTAIASLLTNAFKTVQPSAKDKADTYRRADAHQGYLTQDFTL